MEMAIKASLAAKCLLRPRATTAPSSSSEESLQLCDWCWSAPYEKVISERSMLEQKS